MPLGLASNEGLGHAARSSVRMARRFGKGDSLSGFRAMGARGTLTGGGEQKTVPILGGLGAPRWL